MDGWAAAAASIAAAFADDEPLLYTCFGKAPVEIRAAWSEADLLDGGRKVIYEVRYDAGLPAAPTKRDSFVHRGRSFTPADNPRRHDAVEAWEFAVVDQGAA